LSEDSDPKPTKIDNDTHQPIRIEVLEKMSTLIAAAFAFVAAFAWNESFKLLFDQMVPENVEIFVYFIYAIIITVIAVFIIITIARATARAKAKLQ